MRVSQSLDILDIQTLREIALSLDINQAKFMSNSDEVRSLIRNKLTYFHVYVIVEYNFKGSDKIKKYKFISPEDTELKKGGMQLNSFKKILEEYQKYKDYPLDFTFLTRGGNLENLSYSELHKLIHLFNLSSAKYESRVEMMFKLTTTIKFYTEEELISIPESVLKIVLSETGYKKELLSSPHEFYRKFIMVTPDKLSLPSDCKEVEATEFLAVSKKTRELRHNPNPVSMLRDAIRFKAVLSNFSQLLLSLNFQQLNELFEFFIKQPTNWKMEEKMYYILLLNHFDFGQSYSLESNANKIHACANKIKEFSLDRVNNFVQAITGKKVPYTFISEKEYIKLTKNYSSDLLYKLCNVMYFDYDSSYLTPQRYIASLGERLPSAEKLILQSLTFYTPEEINKTTGLMKSSSNFYLKFNRYLNVFKPFTDFCNPILKIVTPAVLEEILSYYSDYELKRNFSQFVDRDTLIKKIERDLQQPNYWIKEKDISTVDKSLNICNIQPAVYYGNILEYRKMGETEVKVSMTSKFKDPSYPFTVYFTPLQISSYNADLLPPSRTILTPTLYKKYSSALKQILKELYQALNFILTPTIQFDPLVRQYVRYTYYDYFENKISKLTDADKVILFNLGERRLFDEALILTREEDLEMFEGLNLKKDLFIPPILLEFDVAGLFEDPFIK